MAGGIFIAIFKKGKVKRYDECNVVMANSGKTIENIRVSACTHSSNLI